MFEKLKRFFPFLQKKERFLVLEILSKFMQITALKVNAGKKEVEIGNSFAIHHDFESKEMVLALAKRFLKKFGKLNKYKIIATLESGLATTIHGAVVLLRENPKAEIDEADLNNRISQGIWKSFDRSRSEAAAKMKVSDLDVILNDVRVKGVKLDGHKVHDPLGFQAKTVEVQLCHTFNPRFFVEEFGKIIPEDNLVLSAESGPLITDALFKASGEKNFLLVHLTRDRADVFFSDGSAVGHLLALEWGRDDFVKALAKEFLVSYAVAEKIFEAYLEEAASPSFIKKTESLMFEESLKLANCLLKPVQKYEASRIYFFSPFELPEFIFKNKFKSQFPERVSLSVAEPMFISERLGFNILNKGDFTDTQVFSSMFGLVGFYSLPGDDSINKIARRHARWLIS